MVTAIDMLWADTRSGESGLELYKSALPQVDKLAWKQWIDKVQMQGEVIYI